MKKKILKVLLTAVILVMSLGITVLAEDATVTPEGEVKLTKVDSPDSFQNFIDSDGMYSSQAIIETSWKGDTPIYKFSVDEEGWVFIKGYASQKGYADIYLYSNFALTNQLAKGRSDSDEGLVAYVQPGTYYYKMSRWNGYDPMTVTSYLGFMPAAERIKLDDITYSKDKSVATISLDVNEDYFVDFSTSTIRCVYGDVSYTKLSDNKTWKTDNRENCLQSYKFKATKNGTYTFRVASGDKDGYFCMVKVEVDGLKSANPATPKIAAVKKGAKTVSGTAAANTKIYVKVSGKSYTATVSSSGKWSIKSKAALKKGQKITAYVKNTAGSKSKTRTVYVK